MADSRGRLWDMATSAHLEVKAQMDREREEARKVREVQIKDSAFKEAKCRGLASWITSIEPVEHEGIHAILHTSEKWPDGSDIKIICHHVFMTDATLHLVWNGVESCKISSLADAGREMLDDSWRVAGKAKKGNP